MCACLMGEDKGAYWGSCESQNENRVTCVKLKKKKKTNRAREGYEREGSYACMPNNKTIIKDSAKTTVILHISHHNLTQKVPL